VSSGDTEIAEHKQAPHAGARLSLKGAWYLLIVCLALLPVLFTAIYFSYQFKTTSLHNAAREIVLINEEIKDHLEYAIGDVQAMLQVERSTFRHSRQQRSAAGTAFQGETLAELQQQLARRFAILGVHEALLSGIFLVDRATQILALWRRDEAPPADSASRVAKGNRLYIMFPLSETDPAQGMIWAELDVDALWREELDLVNQEGYASYLLDGKGRLLGSGGQAGWLGNSSLPAIMPSQVHGQGPAGQQLQTFVAAGGEMFYGATVSVAGTGWHVVTTVPRQLVLAPIYQTLKDVLMVLVVILLLFVFLGMRMVAGMLGHIAKLLGAFSRAARENYTPLALSSVFNECCQIRDGYNHLVSDLATREQKRRAAEAALSESERQYRSLVNNIPGAIFRSGYDQRGEILYISDAIEAISGYPAQDFLNNAVRSFGSIIHPSDVGLVRETVERAIGQHESYVVEYRVFARDGSLRWVYEKGQPVFDDAGAFLWLDGVIFDISTQKQAEQRHQRLLCEHEAIARAITDVMFTIDVGGELTWYNENLKQFSGLTPQRLKGLPVEELFVADRRHDIGMMIAACIKEGAAEIEAEFLAESGPSPYHVKMVVLRNDSGDIVGIAGSGRDMSHHRRLEKQLQQSQKMQSIGQLTGGIAHDFNNFLTAIIGFTDLARQRSGKDGDAKMAMYLAEVHKAGSRAQELVAQMLAFSRGGEAEAVALELQPVLKETIKMLSASLPSSIELHTEAWNVDARIMADPVQLQQVIMNLCINARDAMKGQGEVHIGLAELHGVRLVCSSCHDSATGDFVELSIRDSGCGMRREVLERIFEPFFSTKATGKGTGMGLAMVHGILHQHGGHIQVESQESEGATFRLLFPLLAQDTVQQSSAGTAPVELPADEVQIRGRVLVVDDEPAVGNFLAELLHSRGCETTVMSDSQAALALFHRDPQAFDLVLTDQTMPGMSGAELAEVMLVLRPDLPIILCTGYSEQIDEVRAKMLGIRRYLSKPIDVMAFLDTVNELLDYKVEAARCLAG